MRRQTTYFILCFVAWSSVSSAQLGASRLPQPSPQEILSEALHQALALEKLPDMQKFRDQDTIWTIVMWGQGKKDSLEFEVRRGHIPSHVEKWQLREIDTLQLSQAAVTRDVSYLEIFFWVRDGAFVVDIINNTRIETGSDKFLIDRGRLTMTFTYQDGVCTLRKLVRWYG